MLRKFLLVVVIFLLQASSVISDPLPTRSLQPVFQDLVSVDFRDKDIRQVFQFLADKGNLNVLLSPKIRGNVTLRVTDMEPRELIFFLARTNGFIIEDNGNILAIYGDQPPTKSYRIEIISLQNAKAAEVAKMIEKLKIDKRTQVTHDERTNRLIVVHEE